MVNGKDTGDAKRVVASGYYSYGRSLAFCFQLRSPPDLLPLPLFLPDVRGAGPAACGALGRGAAEGAGYSKCLVNNGRVGYRGPRYKEDVPVIQGSDAGRFGGDWELLEA